MLERQPPSTHPPQQSNGTVSKAPRQEMTRAAWRAQEGVEDMTCKLGLGELS